MIAGKETGCKFFLLFHTGAPAPSPALTMCTCPCERSAPFLTCRTACPCLPPPSAAAGFASDDGALVVPLAMMDKAFKNKKGKYDPAGVATLHFSPLADQEAAAVDVPLDDDADGGASGAAGAADGVELV